MDAAEELVAVPRGPWLRMDDGTDPPGWYDYADFWRRAVDTAPPRAVLVEVGVFCGRSLIDLAKMARAADKGLRVVGVDSFRGSPEHHELFGAQIPREFLVRDCMLALERHGVRDDVSVIVSDSARAAALFPSWGVWAVFLDADHSEESVAADIAAWRPKIKARGWLGGHDYHTFPGVKAAVDKALPGAVTSPERSWWETRKAFAKGVAA